MFSVKSEFNDQTHLLRAESEQELKGWLLQLNYPAGDRVESMVQRQTVDDMAARLTVDSGVEHIQDQVPSFKKSVSWNEAMKRPSSVIVIEIVSSSSRPSLWRPTTTRPVVPMTRGTPERR